MDNQQKIGLKITISLVLLILIGVLAYFFLLAPKNPIQQSNSSTGTETKTQIPDNKKPESVFANAVLKFPSVSSQSQISFPKEFQFLYVDEAKNTNYQSVKYADGTTGYLLKFDAGLPMQTLHNKYIMYFYRTQPWVVDFGGYNDVAVLIDAHTDQNQVTIKVNTIDQNNSSVVIEIQNKTK